MTMRLYYKKMLQEEGKQLRAIGRFVWAAHVKKYQASLKIEVDGVLESINLIPGDPNHEKLIDYFCNWCAGTALILDEWADRELESDGDGHPVTDSQKSISGQDDKTGPEIARDGL